MTPPEDNYAAWAWLTLAITVTLFVVAFDLWAHFTGHQQMTDQMRVWIGNHTTGPFIVGGWAAIFVGLMWHFLVKGKG